MDIKTHIESLRFKCDKALDKFLPSEKVEPEIIHKAMRYSVFSGGKRIRPILAIESYKACGGKDVRGLFAVASAIEMVHTYSLIHDDLPAMDDDNFRRGKPTCHKVFGEANAILAGDALLTLAFNVIADNVRPILVSEVIKELSRAIGTFGMVGGQALDIEYARKNKSAKIMAHINCLKTARLFQGSAALGAIVAGASNNRIKAISSFGNNLGIAFQIVDDIMDKDGHAKLFNSDKAYSDAKKYTDKAKIALKSFAKKGDILIDIADHILNRII